MKKAARKSIRGKAKKMNIRTSQYMKESLPKYTLGERVKPCFPSQLKKIKKSSFLAFQCKRRSKSLHKSTCIYIGPSSITISSGSVSFLSTTQTCPGRLPTLPPFLQSYYYTLQNNVHWKNMPFTLLILCLFLI